MILRLSMAAGLIAATVVIQALFMSVGLRTFKRIEGQRPGEMARRASTTTVIWILFLLIPIVLDVTLWATFYYASGALPSFEEALYFSTVTFTTVGYGDIVLDREWRQLATFEAVNGWIIFGWATALIMTVVQRLYFPFERWSAKQVVPAAELCARQEEKCEAEDQVDGKELHALEPI